MKSLLLIGFLFVATYRWDFADTNPNNWSKRAAKPKSRYLSINKCFPLWLEILPGIGPTKSSALVLGRPYTEPNDLLPISGIGPQTIKAITPYLNFEP